MSTRTDAHFFQHLVERLGFICIAFDADSRVLFANSEALTAYPQLEGFADGHVDFVELLPEVSRRKARELIGQVLETGSMREMEAKYPQDNGTIMTMVVIFSPVLDDDGNCKAISASMRDISERKRMSRELADSRRIAALGRMAAGVAHHFNNILGGMLTSIDYVLTSDSPRELRRTLRLLAQAISRATRITNQLAVFAESENEQTEWAPLNQILDGFLRKIEARARGAGVAVDAKFDNIEGARFESQRLARVLESIAQNAIDALGVGGVLTVQLRDLGEQAEILIADNGCGMPPETLERVFEPFFTTKGELHGGGESNIGLGLAAVHGYVAEMGGTIRISSQVGEGTQVTIRLPLNRPE